MALLLGSWITSPILTSHLSPRNLPLITLATLPPRQSFCATVHRLRLRRQLDRQHKVNLPAPIYSLAVAKRGGKKEQNLRTQNKRLTTFLQSPNTRTFIPTGFAPNYTLYFAIIGGNFTTGRKSFHSTSRGRSLNLESLVPPTPPAPCMKNGSKDQQL